MIPIIGRNVSNSIDDIVSLLCPDVGAKHSLDNGGADRGQAGGVVYALDGLRPARSKAKAHEFNVIGAQRTAAGGFKAHLLEIDVVSLRIC